MEENIIERLVQEQQSLLMRSFERVKCQELQALAKELAKVKGVIVFTGVGKSGFVAQKVAMTFVSCGTKAIFLSPTDALHGDIGMIDDNDYVVAISRTGESDELLELAPFIKARGARLAALVGVRESRLARLADLVVVTPYERELGVIQMVPTTSAEIQLIFADILAVAVTELKGISLEDFARNHPAGQIGKRLTLKVKDMMLPRDKMPLAHPEDTVGEMLVELSNKRSGCLVVVDKKFHMLGIFTDGDLRRGLEKYGKDTLGKKLQEVMTPTARYICADKLAHDALLAMEENPTCPVTVLAVKQGDEVVGLIRMHDLLQAGI